jgi:hypothetical protein
MTAGVVEGRRVCPDRSGNVTAEHVSGTSE